MKAVASKLEVETPDNFKGPVDGYIDLTIFPVLVSVDDNVLAH